MEQQDLFGRLHEQRRPIDDIAVALRDEALARVAENAGDWFGRALMVIAALERGWVGIGEDITNAVLWKLGPPHHHNASGSLIRMAIQHHLIVPTGEYRKMRKACSHARASPVYRRV